MPTNDPVIAFNRIASITPLLVDNDGNQVDWDHAVTNLQANCLWEDLQNAQPFGIFTIKIDGRADFTPTAPGIFTIKCIVTYKEPISGKNNIVSGLLLITVPVNFNSDIEIKYTPFKVSVSINQDNRLTTDGMGALYVPEVTTNLADLYSQASQ